MAKKKERPKFELNLRNDASDPDLSPWRPDNRSRMRRQSSLEDTSSSKPDFQRRRNRLSNGLENGCYGNCSHTVGQDMVFRVSPVIHVSTTGMVHMSTSASLLRQGLYSSDKNTANPAQLFRRFSVQDVQRTSTPYSVYQPVGVYSQMVPAKCLTRRHSSYVPTVSETNSDG